MSLNPNTINLYYLCKTASTVSCVQPSARQWNAMLRDDIGFPMVYRRIYRSKFFMLSKQTSHYIREWLELFTCVVLSPCFSKLISTTIQLQILLCYQLFGILMVTTIFMKLEMNDPLTSGKDTCTFFQSVFLI